MDFRFGLIAIFLVTDMISTRSTAFSIPAPDNNSTSRTISVPSNIWPVSSRLLSMKDLSAFKSPVEAISERKCEEYAREIMGITLVRTRDSDVRIVPNRSCRSASRLATDSNAAQEGEFPHMVAVGNRNSDEGNEFIQFCGGTLISHTWVLSAAHCIHNIDRANAVKIGTTRLTDQKGVIIAIKHAIVHPNYKSPAMYADIALIELMNSVTFNTFIQPACLYQQYDTVPRKAWITGWGFTSFDGDKGSDQLLKTQLDVVDNLYCASQYNASEVILPYGIATSMICAGDPRNNWTRDSCKGDSGGPLQVLPESECLFQVIGIVSFGRGCALYQIPNVYTRVSYYLPWIEDNVWPHGQ